MSGHTAGPWRVYVPESAGATFGVDSVDGNAVVWFGPTYDEGIRRIEDARLIAAAPDLLAALEDLADVAQVLRPETVGDEMDKEARIAYAQFAIAKARGEQP